MEKKIKLIIIGLIGILIISLFINLSTYNAKQVLERQNNDLKKENASLIQKIEASLQDSRRLENRISALNADLGRVSQEKEDLQKKLDLVSRERQELIKELKEQRRTVEAAPEQRVPLSEDAYWGSILKAKTNLELQLENIRGELKIAQINNEQLQRQKADLELEVKNLTRDQEDLKRQLEYNQKLMDALSQELVREKNDKFQIVESLKPLKAENEILRRQLKSLNSRKIDLERNFLEIQKENSRLTNRVSEMETFLEGKSQQIENLKKQLDAFSKGEPFAVEEKESVELPPIVVRPQAEASAQAAAVELTGRVLALNKDNNFVIIDLGEERGVKVGDTFRVYRDQKNIADIEVVQARRAIAACDIKKEISPIKVGDTVR